MLRSINHGVAKTVKIVALRGDAQMEETGQLSSPQKGSQLPAPWCDHLQLNVWPSAHIGLAHTGRGLLAWFPSEQVSSTELRWPLVYQMRSKSEPSTLDAVP